MKKLTDKIEAFLEWGGTRREVVLLVISGAALLASIFELAPLPFDPAWVAIVLCGVPILLDEMNRKGMLNRGDKIVLSGFGAGLTWGTALLEW